MRVELIAALKRDCRVVNRHVGDSHVNGCVRRAPAAVVLRAGAGRNDRFSRLVTPADHWVRRHVDRIRAPKHE